MMYGLPDTTFIAIVGIPTAIVLVLIAWGKFYHPEEDE